MDNSLESLNSSFMKKQIEWELVQIESGNNHSLALDSEGKVYAWGRNSEGQLGDGTNIDRSIPVLVDISGVLNGKNIVKVSAGADHSLALDDQGKVYAWGRNNEGQLGDGNFEEYDDYGSNDYGYDDYGYDDYGYDDYGSNDYGYTFQGIDSNVPVEVDTSGVLGGKNIVEIRAGSFYSLALDDQGKVYSWGSNFNGQLGDGTTIKRFTPVEVDTSGVLDGKNIIQISAGGDYSLALDDQGKVYAWGDNFNGQLGDGNLEEYYYYGYVEIRGIDSSVPVEVDTSGVLEGKNIVQVSAGGFHSLALDEDGKVYSWGYNGSGELGDGTDNISNVPVEVVDGNVDFTSKNIVQVSAGISHSLALDSDGKVYSWGEGYQGELGIGINGQRSVPVEVYTSGVLEGKNIVQIRAGQFYSVALDSFSDLYSWGYNFNGQLGDGTNTDRNVPGISLLNKNQYSYQPQYEPNITLSENNDNVILFKSENEDENIYLSIEYKINDGEYQSGNSISFSEEGTYNVTARAINFLSGLTSPEFTKVVVAYLDENVVTGLINPLNYEGQVYTFGGYIEVYGISQKRYFYVEHTSETIINIDESITERISDTITKVYSNSSSSEFSYNGGEILGVYDNFENGIRLMFFWFGHPADLSKDYVLGMIETGKYLEEFLSSDQIPESFKDKAKELWLNGEAYERLEDEEEPDCWVNLS